MSGGEPNTGTPDLNNPLTQAKILEAIKILRESPQDDLVFIPEVGIVGVRGLGEEWEIVGLRDGAPVYESSHLHFREE